MAWQGARVLACFERPVTGGLLLSAACTGSAAAGALQLLALRGLHHVLPLVRPLEVPAGDGGDPLPLWWAQLRHAPDLPRPLLQPQHPLRDRAAGLPHDPDNAPQGFEVLDREEGDRRARSASAACAADPVDVGARRLREVVVHDRLHALEVDAAGHEVCADQHPDLAQSECLHGVVPLLLSAVGVDRVHEDAVIDELPKELLCALFRLHKDQRWRLHLAVVHHLPEAEELAILMRDEKQALIYIRCRGVCIADAHSERVRENGASEVTDCWRQSR
mmetsp:Transcript_93273/g.283164  ORF Transcript_93273/g.283164 Transcript_93273/m.283164 type:complete len:276 (+) Transcript_93273:115-942(+)